MIILSIDGGASRTRGTIFTSVGQIRVFSTSGPTSLTGGPKAIARLTQFMLEVVEEADLEMADIGLVAVGLAGMSNADARDQLLKAMEALGIADKLVLTSDVEAAFESVFGNQPGVLLAVGTGAIAWARDAGGNSYRASGRGPQLGGDPGSGYWIGKTLMINLIMAELDQSDDLNVMRQLVVDYYEADDFEDAARKAGEVADQYHIVAGLARFVCEQAEAGNEIALAILQEGTMGLAEELLPMLDRSDLKTDQLVLGISGSIIETNELFRNLLAEAMVYDIPEIIWRRAKIDAGFGSGLIAARLKSEKIDMQTLMSNWELFVASTRS